MQKFYDDWQKGNSGELQGVLSQTMLSITFTPDLLIPTISQEDLQK